MQKISARMKCVFQCVLLALGTVILLIVLNNLFRPVYINVLNKNIELKIVATAEQNEEALANNVRITHIAVNGKDIDLSKTKFSGGSQWAYDSKNDFLYAYNLSEQDTVLLNLKNLHTLSVTMVQEEGSGQVELYLDGELWEKVDLYEDESWDETKITFNTSKLVFAEENPEILLGTFAICLLIWILVAIRRKKFSLLLEYGAGTIVISWHLALLMNGLIILIQYGSINGLGQYINDQPQLFLRTAVLMFLTIISLSILTGRLWIAFLPIAAISLILVVINNIKLLNRGTPLLPWDFSMAGEALSVAAGYEINIGATEIVSLVIIIVIACALFVFWNKKIKLKPLWRIVALGGFAIDILFANTNFINASIEENDTDYRVYQLDNYYSQRGFIPAFLEYCVYLDTGEKPDGYSKETMEDLCLQVDSTNVLDNDMSTNTPTIIAIMDESFWDAERLDTVSFSEELLPNFNALKAESSYGELFTHVLSGGTVTSEFEFLTGFSGEFFPQDYMVYGNYMYSGFPSVVSILEEQGYSTLAIHPYLATNYNRENAYKKLGFDRCIFDEDFENPQMVRDYISDQCTFERIIDEYEKGKKNNCSQFIFTVTMQNHGGYWEDTINEEAEVDFETNQYGDVAQACMTDYFAGLHETDAALGKLVDYFRETDEDIVIIYFGDHMSDAGPKDDRMFSQTEWKDDTLEYDYETHRVPFLVWSNIQKESKDLGIMEVGELLPTVFNQYGIQFSEFWSYLLKMKESFTGSDGQLFINTDGSYEKLSEMTGEQKQYYETYELLQYDCIWGEHYASEVFTLDAQ